MAECTLLRAAEEDLIGIWLYIADEDQQAATRVLQSIEDAFRLLAGNARLGPAREDIAPGLRYFVVGSYLVLYREIPDGVEVVRVLHGARDLAAALQ
ncbi:MAG: type II toxin-antitoxin system RelE/ParE family toxin [Desulfovibrionaceae bacterium]|jgi:toxin ParE1/3/4|nr:type II toxin-antitoxin system RelE/ParE family toxin [Desulfovibrionaceae bacterium]